MHPILLAGHERSLTQIKFNREGDLLFSASKDNLLCAWFWHNGERLGTYEGHQGAIWSVDITADSSLLISGSADNTARLWQVETGKLLHTWDFPTAVKWAVFSNDGKFALLTLERRMGYPGAIVIVEIKPLGEEQNPEPITIMQPKDSKALVGGWGPLDKFIIAGHEDGTISQWDWEEGLLLKTVNNHVKLITDMQFSEDHSYFVTASKDSTARLFDSKTLQLLKTYKPADKTPLNSAAILPAPVELVVVGGGQEAMDVTRTSQRAGKFESRFYNKIFEEEIGRVKGHFGPINTIAVHPSGNGYASGAEDGFIRLHQFDKGYQKFAEDSLRVE